MQSSRYRISAVAAAATLFLALSAPVAAGVVVEQRSFDARELVVRNLIGEITVEGHGGSGFEVEIRIEGDEASRGGMDIVTSDGSPAGLTVVFPKARTFIYPRLGDNSHVRFDAGDSDGGWLGEMLGSVFGRGRVEVRGSGSGVEVWADLKIRVPSGGRLTVQHGVGTAEATNVDGDLKLAVRAGSVSASQIAGSLVADTGSGHVEVRGVRGDLLVDTGSGHVSARDIEGGSVNIDTGSGHVEVEGLRTGNLRIDTGSGHVEARGVGADSAVIDTGSGSVTLELQRMGEGRFNIDTGSGRIDLTVPEGASGEFQAETGSGGIDLDMDDEITLVRKERDEVRFRIGGGGARFTLSTGSGGIRIHR